VLGVRRWRELVTDSDKNWKRQNEEEDPGKDGEQKVERHLQVLGGRRWRELGTDSDKWRGIVR
jgi:hypothetical protein